MKFKKKQQIEEQDNYEYWKDPRLDDEGTYDYLAEELPSDTEKWERGYQRCESCGKDHWLNFTSTHYFYCWDGWDSMSYTECWRCKLKSKVCGVKYKMKKKHERRKEYRWHIRQLKSKGVPVTKEIKEIAKKICQLGD